MVFAASTTSCLAAILALSTAPIQDRKPTLKPEEFGQWETLGQTSISSDGRWFAANIGKVDGDGRLILRSCDGPERWETPVASGFQFSDDAKWAAYSIGAPKAERERAAQQRRRIENRLGIRNLMNGSETVIDGVTGWTFAKGSRHLILEHYRPQDKRTGGAEIEVVDLADLTRTPLSNVSSWRLDPTGETLAVVIEGEVGLRGLQLVHLPSMQVKTIRWGRNATRNLTFAAKAKVLAFFELTPDEKMEGDWAKLVVVSDYDQPKPTVRTFEPKEIKGFPEGRRILDVTGIEMTEDGQTVAFGVKPWAAKKPENPRPQDVPGVEIWHSRDVIVMPLQRNTAGQEAFRADRYVFRWGTGELRMVAEASMDDVSLTKGMNYALFEDRIRHASPVKENGMEFSDVWLVDVWSGKRTMILERVVGNVGGLGASTLVTSPGGGYAAYFAGGDWFVVNLATGRATNATARSKESFANPLDDRTLPAKAAAQFPTWLAGDAGVVFGTVYDEFLYNPRTDQLTKLTDGRASRVSHSLINVGLSEDGIQATDPMYFSLFNEQTKASGIGRRERDGSIRVLVMDDMAIQFAGKAKNTDRVLFRMQSFAKSPNAYITNLEFSQAKALTNTNPQQANYAWGKAELVNFKNSKGVELQGILYFPADYNPGRSYPMITYIYERLSDGLHSYKTPNPQNYYDLQRYSQSGYFVFQPDIAYDDRGPGIGAVDCIEAGVKAVLAKKIGVDAARLGLTGHSWGGYQSVFVATQSKMFSAYVSGAALTEMIAMSNSFYWNWGQSNQVIFESSQGRLPLPFLKDLDRYIANSPLFHVEKVRAPMLLEAGTVDGAVDWTQSQFFYNTMRRMGKEMILLVYANENHGLANPANQKDFARRAAHFFDVYLKGARPDDWVKNGVPFVKLGEHLSPPPTGG